MYYGIAPFEVENVMTVKQIGMRYYLGHVSETKKMRALTEIIVTALGVKTQ